MPPFSGLVVVIPGAVLEPLQGRTDLFSVRGLHDQARPVRQGYVAVERTGPETELNLPFLSERRQGDRHVPCGTWNSGFLPGDKRQED